MPNVSIALIKEINKRFSSTRQRDLVWSSKLSRETLNSMMKRAYERLSH